MPYKVHKRGDQWCVVKETTNETVACHDTEDSANSQMRALYASENKTKTIGYDAPMRVIKQSNGRYRWYGTSSVNALDRDKEIISERALAQDVYRTKVYGEDDSILAVFHIVNDEKPEATRIGGAPDWRCVTEGQLLESGEFDDTTLGRAFAKFFMDHPESTDGGGWGISIGFLGNPDNEGVFDQVHIKERSVLPLSVASNPFTMFNVSTIENEKESDMPFNDKQLKFLSEAQAMTSDPEMVEAVKLLLAAQGNSKMIDAAGIQRKTVQSPLPSPTSTVQLQSGNQVTTTAPVVGVPLITGAGQYNVQPIAEQLGFAPQMKAAKQGPDEVAAVAQAQAAMNVAADAVMQAATAVSAVSDAVVTEETSEGDMPMDMADANVASTDTMTTDETKADTPTPPSAPATDKPSGLTDADLEQIAKFVDARIQAAMDTMNKQMDTVTKALSQGMSQALAEASETSLVKAYNEQPRPSIAERLMQLSVARSDVTKVKKDSEAYVEQGKSMKRDPELVPSIKESLGFQ